MENDMKLKYGLKANAIGIFLASLIIVLTHLLKSFKYFELIGAAGILFYVILFCLLFYGKRDFISVIIYSITPVLLLFLYDFIKTAHVFSMTAGPYSIFSPENIRAFLIMGLVSIIFFLSIYLTILFLSKLRK